MKTASPSVTHHLSEDGAGTLDLFAGSEPPCPVCGGWTMCWSFGTVCTACHHQFEDPEAGAL